MDVPDHPAHESEALAHTEPATVEPQQDGKARSFPLIGIGASAGGLESLERLFANIPPEPGMAFAVIQHLSPDFKSMMDELLARHTSMPIHRAEDGMAVQENHVYLLPPKMEMIVAGGLLHLTDKDPTQGLTLPIDHFFRSLAHDFGPQAAAIILSGTGSDGSRGIVDVSEGGGLVLSESQHSAKFDGMPLSAQETGVVNLVLAPEEMPAELIRYFRDEPIGKRTLPEAEEEEPLEGVEAVFGLLRNEYGIDFSHYKPTTVSRRIERRLALMHTTSLEHYVERLRDDPDELNLLYKDLLIGVTSFFRDAESFQRLESDVIPDLLQRVPRNEDIRVWVAGCATGEEAYSLAILLHEALKLAERPINMKILATDVHKASLDVASHGVYDEDRLSAVSPDRLRRYFTRKSHSYQVSQDLRQLIVFAPHNVIKDAPFTNLDLITCRNLLIYFQPPAQKKALSLFHFGLKTGGVLFLGSSESPGELADEFDTLDGHCKIFRKRRDIRLPADMRLPLAPGSKEPPHPKVPMTTAVSPYPDAALFKTYDCLLDRYMPPSLLVNDRCELIDSFGGAERLLHFKGRRPSNSLLDLLEAEVKPAITGALSRCMKHQQAVRLSRVRLKTAEGLQVVRLSIEPIAAPSGRTLHYLISLEPTRAAAPGDPARTEELSVDEATRDKMGQMAEELRYTQENLQATIEELETANEELQATNQELVASNEELQSTNEELHSVNEELYTVNAEHQKKIKELAELNQDMTHLLDSGQVATVFLDLDLCIRKFTPCVAEIFELVEHDVGRRISTFAHKIQYDGLLDDLQRAIEQQQTLQQEVRGVNGRYYFMRILPYRSNSRVHGVVLTLVDTSALHEAHSKIQMLSAIVESSHDAIIGKDLNNTITTWNRGAEQLYGFSAEEAIGQNIALIVPDDRRDELQKICDRTLRGERVPPLETVRATKDRAPVDVSLTVSPIHDDDGNVVGASHIARDITERKRAEERFRTTVEAAPLAIIMIDEEGHIVLANTGADRMFGYPREELLGRKVEVLLPERYRAAHVANRTRYAARPQSRMMGLERVLCAQRHNGSEFPVEIGLNPVRTSEGRFVLAGILDVTEKKRAEEEIREAVRRRDRFLAMLSHELRNPLGAIRSATRLLSDKSLPADVDAEARRVLERQTSVMARLLDDLLDVSRFTQDKLRIHKERVDLASTVTVAVEEVQLLATENQIRVDVDIADAPLWIFGDAARLVQALANLLTNAIKYSPAGERVEVKLWGEVCEDGVWSEAAARQADSDADGARSARRYRAEALLSIRDNGVGIAPDMLESIFDMFVQADSTLDRSQGGMGVGLTLVRSIIEMHDGTVTANSAGEGCGSDFRIRLPLAQSPVPRPQAVPAGAPKSQHRILLVEDQQDARRMLRSLLEMDGHQVREASDGFEALEVVQRDWPDVALLDVGLPQMDGYELARRLRAHAEGRPLLLVALTGYGQAEDVQKAFAAGFDHHLVKPLKPDDLDRVLQGPARQPAPTADSAH